MPSRDNGIIAQADRQEIIDVIHRVAFILDSGEYDRMGEVFSPDMQFENPGRLKADGLQNVIAAFKKITNPAISHHITNVILTPVDSGTVRALSKALTLRAENTIAAAEYSDVVTKTDAGWRISSRNIKPLS